MAEAAWAVLPDPLSPALPVVVVTRSETGRAINTVGVVGRGLLRPFRRDQKQDFASGTGIDLIAASVGQILGTICSSENTGGELPWRTEFGSLLQVLRLSNASPALAEKARAFVAGALSRWEPRAQVTSVHVARNIRSEGSGIIVRVRWRLVAAGTERVVVAGLETEIAVG